MPKQLALRPLDVPVALRLAERPGATFDALHQDLGISASTAHQAVARLEAAGLVHPHQRKVNRTALLEFLEHGVRYAFPAATEPGSARGVPTAHAAPVLSDEIVSLHAFVWPRADGPTRGEPVTPLYEQAVELPERCPSVYELLALVDALRVGRTRERAIAARKLRARLGCAAHA